MSEKADVYKNRVRAASLSREAGGTVFTYDDDYLRAGLPPVASTLPLTREPHITPAGAVPPFFAGLLPEGRRLTTLRRSIKASADDELALLTAIGGDTIGDVQIVRAGSTPTEVATALDLPASLTQVLFAELVADTAPFDRVGLPGVQDKVSGRMIAVHARRASKRYILKLNPPEYPHVVENEHYFIALARHCRIPTVEAEIVHDRDGNPGLLVTRFDRMPSDDGIPILRAVEDACQALGRWPADKYSVTTEAVVQRLGGLSAASAVATRDAFRQIVFAILTGNGDLHAKNMAVLAGAAGEFRLSPAYDLPSTVFYRDRTLALPILGKRTGISRRILLEFAEEIRLPRRAAVSVLDDLLTRTSDLTGQLRAGALPFAQEDTARAAKELTYRRRLLLP